MWVNGLWSGWLNRYCWGYFGNVVEDIGYVVGCWCCGGGLNFWSF